MKHTGLRLLLYGVSAVIAGYFSIQLYRNLNTDFEELLPNEARSVVDLQRVKDRMESTANLAVLVFSDRPEQSRRFVDDLALRIKKKLPHEISRVEYKIDEEIEFFTKRRALMMDLDDLRAVDRYIDSRLEYEREIRNPFNILNGRTLIEPRFDPQELLGKYQSRVSDYTRFKGGYYATPDEKIRVVLVYVAGNALGVEPALKLREGVDQILAEMNPASYDPRMKIRFTGEVQNLLEERASLIADLELSSIVVAALVALSMAFYFRNLFATFALVVSLVVGTLWTFGVSYFVVGYLNANSAFLGSIIMGNGINFGIVLLARYMEERNHGVVHSSALKTAIRTTRAATLTAALAAGLSYGALGITQFRGFRQFGIIGSMGMAMSWIAAYTVLPTILNFLASREKKARRYKSAEERTGFSNFAAHVVNRAPRVVLVASFVLTVSLGVLAWRQTIPLLETDTSKLRDKRSLESGSGYLSKYLNQIFGRYLSPLVILPSTREKTALMAQKLRQLKKKEWLISNVYSIDDFVPKDQGEKIRVIRSIQDKLKPEILAQASASDRKLVKSLFSPESMRTFTVDDLPEMIRARFRENDGTFGKPILVEPLFNEEILFQFENQDRLIREVREVADSVEPGVPIVGQLPLLVDMLGSVKSDGPKSTALALFAVMIVVVAVFRKVVPSVQALFALILGVSWAMLFARAVGVKVNFLNFIALPITFGIGVDYAVNLLTRYQSERKQGIAHIVATTGGAVALASMTTIIGYGSLLMANNQGFVSFGSLAILGEFSCILSAMFTLPAMLEILERRRALREKPPVRTGDFQSEHERKAA